MTNGTLITEIEKLIAKTRPDEKRRLIIRLPKLFKITDSNLENYWLKLSAPSFDFWNNPEDAAYDNL